MSEEEQIKESNTTGGRVFKARLIGGTDFDIAINYPSKQLIEDPFSSLSGYGDVITTPIYSLEQLVLLAEAHPVHGAALEQKTFDVVGGGPELLPLDDSSDDKQKDEISAWLESLSEYYTFEELLQAVQMDFETIGWGFLEIVRDVEGKVRRVHHIPGHTVRAHRDNMRYVQIRQGKQAWFKRWGLGEEWEQTPILLSTGRKAPEGTKEEKLANEVMPFVKMSRRSTWYGIPNYVSAMGHITLAIAARDYNVKFFANSREPRYLYIMSGLDEDDVDSMMDELEVSLRTQHGEPHRSLAIPLTGSAKLTIERITAVQNDMHFVKLLEATERDILIAHRVPPDRIGAVMRGFLGGNVAASINKVYKEAVITPAQMILRNRLNRFVRKEFARHANIKEDQVQWEIGLESVDLSDETVDISNAVVLVKANMVTLNEARQRIGEAPRGEEFDVTLAEWMAEHGGTGGAALNVAMGEDSRIDAVGRSQEALMQRLEQLDSLTRELLLGVEEYEPSTEAS